MENIGLNSEMVAGGRSFHVQTQYLEPGEKIISSVFDEGKVLFSREIEVKSITPASEIKLQVNRLHQEVITDFEVIFYISEKVRMIKHAVSNNKLGLVFLNRNLFDEAVTEFKKALEIDPNFAEAYNNLGNVLLKQKRYEDAIDVFTDGIEKDGNYADLHNNLGLAYFRINKYKEAIHELTTAIEINDDYSDAIFNLCLVYLKTTTDEIQDSGLPSIPERIEKAKQLLDALKDKEQYSKPEYFHAALEYLDKGNTGEAIKPLERADSERLERIDKFQENEFYLKFMFGGKGKDDEFIRGYTEQLKQAVEKCPGYADLRNNLGIAYLIQCRNLFLNALEAFREALKINPEFKKAEKNLKLAENDGKGFLILLRAILK